MAAIQYLKNRLSEKETQVALAGAALGIAGILFPQYVAILNVIGTIMGVSVAAAPTSKSLASNY